MECRGRLRLAASLPVTQDKGRREPMAKREESSTHEGHRRRHSREKEQLTHTHHSKDYDGRQDDAFDESKDPAFQARTLSRG